MQEQLLRDETVASETVKLPGKEPVFRFPVVRLASFCVAADARREVKPRCQVSALVGLIEDRLAQIGHDAAEVVQEILVLIPIDAEESAQLLKAECRRQLG